MQARVFILDVDGTLVDTNYQHVLAWYRAFREHDIVLPLWRIHRHIGMGGDQVVGALTDEDTERRIGDDVRTAEKRHYQRLIDEVAVMAQAHELLEDLSRSSCSVVLASSAKPEELDRYLDLLDARDLVDGWTDSGDVEATKPEPDLVHAALGKVGADAASAVMVGDSTWDFEAAKRAAVAGVGLLTGGFSREELRASGAARVFESIAQLRRAVADGVLAGAA